MPKTIKSQVISGVYSTRNVKLRNKYMQLNNKITHVKSRNIEKTIKLVDCRWNLASKNVKSRNKWTKKNISE